MAQSLFTLSSSPHIRSNQSINNIMKDVTIALLPAAAAGVYFFKLQALLVMITCVASAVISEYIWQKATKKEVTIDDFSAVVTGLLVAFNVPPTLPLWMGAIGSIFAIIICKQFFGGLGMNVVNPALAARIFLLASWPVDMTTWTLDGVTGPTALAILKGGHGGNLPTMFDAFFGRMGGCIGETSALAILLGGLYLIYKRVITWHIPVSYLGTVVVFMTIFGRSGMMTGNGLYEVVIGGAMLGGIFMATDYTTSPMTFKGQIIYGICGGLLLSIIRLWGGYPEGCSYSILIMNLFVPIIDKYTIPKVFGEVKKNG